MAKDKNKKAKKAGSDHGELEIIAGPANDAGKKKGKKSKHNGKGNSGLESLARLADHPLLSDLLAVGALAAVAAIAESGKGDTAKVKSANAVKTAGKAAAAAIGARLLKEMTSSSDAKKKEA